MRHKLWLLVFSAVVWLKVISYAPEQLQRCYVKNLISYLETPYVWGGESQNGIDCSGLVRLAFIKSLRQIGVSYLRPDLLWRHYILKWHDFRAKDIINDSHHFILIKRVRNLHQDNLQDLKPGDLGVLESGSHVMAYLGNGDWIEANGSQNKVIRVHAPHTSLKHYSKPVLIFRWRSLL